MELESLSCIFFKYIPGPLFTHPLVQLVQKERVLVEFSKIDGDKNDTPNGKVKGVDGLLSVTLYELVHIILVLSGEYVSINVTFALKELQKK